MCFPLSSVLSGCCVFRLLIDHKDELSQIDETFIISHYALSSKDFLPRVDEGQRRKYI